jgi:branched-subunit amino acid aminotransferase/4-amino-4-deoxychorismate lyase
MIWVGGRIVPDDALQISALDRTFEHGLGLFETFRTWSGRPTLLNRHLGRMRQSAELLGLSIGSVTFPDETAISELMLAEQVQGDAGLRITLSGGLSDEGGAVLWMRVFPLPPGVRKGGALITLSPREVNQSDPLTQHKALNYWLRRMAYEEAKKRGFDEVLSMSPGRYWEGSRTNVFVIKGDVLMTPSIKGPLVPGIMRGLVLEQVRDLPLIVEDEISLTRNDIARAEEVFLTNSVRGIIPVGSAHCPIEEPPDKVPYPDPYFWTWPAPGPWTQRLWSKVSDWLHSGGKAS